MVALHQRVHENAQFTCGYGDQMVLEPDAMPRRINLGCGWDKRPGHLNVDLHAFHEPDLVADITELTELPTGYFVEIVAQDVLEHLPREKAPIALREWARICAIDGRLHLRVPNLLGLAHLLSVRPAIDDQRALIQCAYGTQAYDGDFHLNGYTELLLRHDLYEAGFGEATFTPRDEWLFDVEAVRMEEPRAPTFADCRYMNVGLPSELSNDIVEPSEPTGSTVAPPPVASLKRLVRRARRLGSATTARSR